MRKVKIFLFILALLGFLVEYAIQVQAPPDLVIEHARQVADYPTESKRLASLVAFEKQKVRKSDIVLASRHLFRGRELLVQATAYSLAVEDCEKEPDDPDYGITASGEEVEEWHTIAADKSIPLGTKVYIPYFRDKSNKGLFVVDDRGGAIKGNKIDIYMSNREDAKKWGRRTLSIFILEE